MLNYNNLNNNFEKCLIWSLGNLLLDMILIGIHIYFLKDLDKHLLIDLIINLLFFFHINYILLKLF
jgi:hypothetical protein